MVYKRVYLELDDEDIIAKLGVYRNIVKLISARYSGSDVIRHPSANFLDEPHEYVVEIRLFEIEKSIYLEFKDMALSEAEKTVLEIFRRIDMMFDREYQTSVFKGKKVYSAGLLDPEKLITTGVELIPKKSEPKT